MKYWSPSEYYTKKNKESAGYLMPWERVSEVRQTKKIFADIQIVYQDEEGKDVEFNSAKEFEVQYIEEQITLNPYVILALLLLSSVGLLLWFALRWWFLVVRKHRCWNCKEVIKAHWETCPYCKTLQDKNEHKRFEKQKEASSPTPVRRGRKKKENS